MEEVLGQIARAAQAYLHRAACKGSDGTLTYAALWAKAQAAAGPRAIRQLVEQAANGNA